MGLRSRLATGIHIVDSMVHTVVLESHQRQVVLKGIGHTQLPGPFNGQQLADAGRRRQMAQALAGIGPALGLELRHVFIALDTREVFIKRRPLGEEDEDSQYEQLQWEAGYFLPSAADEYGMDFLLTPFGGFVIAVQRRLLDLYTDLYRQAGFRDPGVDIVPFALYNLLEQTGQLGQDRVDLLLDIRDAECQLVLLDYGHVRALELVRWQRDLSAEQKADELVNRVQKALRDEGNIDMPHQLWLTGTVETEEFWHSELEQRLAVDTQVIDPFPGLDISELDDEALALLDQSAAFAVAAGLAYRSLSE